MRRHLLSVDDVSREDIERILGRAESFAEVSGREIKKVPTLRGRTVINLFYEASTRTSSSFELAAKRLSADLVSVKSSGSSVEKGESLKDTVQTLSAYDPAAIVIRSPHAGAAGLVARWTPASVINAGDGKHEHPTQALLDLYTLRRRVGSLEGLSIWIVGDVLHSRVARSGILAFTRMGCEVTVCGPPTLIPRGIESLGCEVRHTLDGLARADVVYALRMQHERMEGNFVPVAARVRGAVPDRRPAPGRRTSCSCTPARSTAASSSPAEVIDSPQALIVEQVESGVVVRMAVLYELLAGRGAPTRSRPVPERDHGAAARMSALELDRARRPAGDAADPRRRTCWIRAPGSTASRDLLVRDGRIAELGDGLEAPEGAEVVDAAGLHALPAFVDPHVHLRTPGREDEEDVDSGTRAAAAGGYCAILAMPNTDPVVDSAPVLRSLRERARAEARIPTGFLAAITRGQRGRGADRDGRALRRRRRRRSPTTGCPCARRGVLRQALQYQRLAGRTLALHEEDPSLSADGVMHEGEISALLGLAGIPSVSESTMVAARLRAGRLRAAAGSTSSTCPRARRCEAIERARELGTTVTCEATPHHLLLTDEAVRDPRRQQQDEPAAPRRGRPPGADRGAALGRRSTAWPPTTPRTRARRRSSRSSWPRWA